MERQRQQWMILVTGGLACAVTGTLPILNAANVIGLAIERFLFWSVALFIVVQLAISFRKATFKNASTFLDILILIVYLVCIGAFEYHSRSIFLWTKARVTRDIDWKVAAVRCVEIAGVSGSLKGEMLPHSLAPLGKKEDYAFGYVADSNCGAVPWVVIAYGDKVRRWGMCRGCSDDIAKRLPHAKVWPLGSNAFLFVGSD